MRYFPSATDQFQGCNARAAIWATLVLFGSLVLSLVRGPQFRFHPCPCPNVPANSRSRGSGPKEPFSGTGTGTGTLTGQNSGQTLVRGPVLHSIASVCRFGTQPSLQRRGLANDYRCPLHQLGCWASVGFGTKIKMVLAARTQREPSSVCGGRGVRAESSPRDAERDASSSSPRSP